MGIKIDEGDLRRILRKIEGVEKIVEARASANALTAVAREVRNEAIDRTKREFPSLAASKIRSAIELQRATPDFLEARIDISRRPVNLIRFGARQSKGRGRSRAGRQVTAILKRGREVIAGAFIAVGRSGNRLVFRRTSRSRLPITGAPGPSVGGILRKHVDSLLALANRNISAEIADKVRKALGSG